MAMDKRYLPDITVSTKDQEGMTRQVKRLSLDYETSLIDCDSKNRQQLNFSESNYPVKSNCSTARHFSHKTESNFRNPLNL